MGIFFKSKKKNNQANQEQRSAFESWIAQSSSGIKAVTNTEAMTISAVFASIRILSNSVASLPCILYRNLPDKGKEKATNNSLYLKLRLKPNKNQLSIDFFRQIMLSLTMRGNAYIHKILAVDGSVLELYCLHPDLVRVKSLGGGKLQYSYRNYYIGSEERIFKDYEITHIRGLSIDGIMGISPLDQAAQTLAIAKAAEEHGANFFGNGINPAGILQHPTKLSPEAAKKLKDRFVEAYGGTKNANSAMVLEEGMTWQQISLTNEQSQFIETRKFEVTEVARWFGVPPHKIGDLDRATFSNIEHQALEFINDSLKPYLISIETALLTSIFPEKEWGNYTIEFLIDALLRGDTLSRYQAHQIGINNGILSLDEVRSMENRNPLPEDLGKNFYMPLNIGKIKKESEIEAVQEPVANEPVIQQDPEPDPAIRALASDIINRVHRRALKMKEENKVNLEKFVPTAKKELDIIQRQFNIDQNSWNTNLEKYFNLITESNLENFDLTKHLLD